MPHALPAPAPGLQAIILCGPGHSLDTFTSNAEELPKALIPIANRPMVWYSLDWCYRMGISSIYLVSPASSLRALEAALFQNPHLTSLPSPRAGVIGPRNLTQTSGTADVLRSPEVRAIIKGDFLVLPCDLVCDIPGETFLNAWMTQQPKLVSGSLAPNGLSTTQPKLESSVLGKGGLSVCYNTTCGNIVKGEETDFLITAPLERPYGPRTPTNANDNLSRLVYYTTNATLKDITGDDGSLPIRHGLMQRYGCLKALKSYRDAHIYVLPHWTLDVIGRNPDIDSLSEDLIGLWAKAAWQKGLGEKLGLQATFGHSKDGLYEPSLPDYADIEHMSSTKSAAISKNDISEFRVTNKQMMLSTSMLNEAWATAPAIPPMITYIQKSEVPLIRRVDTSALLLHVSLQLARLDAIEDVDRTISSPLAHQQKIAHPSGIAPRSTVTKGDCLLAENVTVEEKSVIKESVIGANCQIKSGSRISRCVLMDGAVVGEKSQLTGCILGKRSQIGRECVLRDCEIQDGNQVPGKTDSKGEKFVLFEGLDGSDGHESENDTDYPVTT